MKADFYGFTKKTPEPCVCAIGTFDGVHIGHRALLARTKDAAGKAGCAFGVIIICREGEFISTLDDRLRVIRSVGADFAFVWRLEDIRSLCCRDFVDMIRDDCFVRSCVCGYNFRFGAGATGDAHTLDELIGADIMPPFEADGIPVSSTHIRSLIKSGEMERVRALLSRPYTLHGKVTRGRGVGHSLGSPTANTEPEKGVVMPPNGVYISEIIFDGESRRAVTNIGVRPTFDSGDIRIESYIPGFSGDIYGKWIGTALLKRIRDERKFVSPEELGKQIKEDVKKALEYEK